MRTPIRLIVKPDKAAFKTRARSGEQHRPKCCPERLRSLGLCCAPFVFEKPPNSLSRQIEESLLPLASPFLLNSSLLTPVRHTPYHPGGFGKRSKLGMASADASQSSEPHETQYPSQSTAFRGQRIWVSPDFGQSLELYQWIVTSHGAELVSDMGEKDVFHLLPKFQGVRDSILDCFVCSSLLVEVAYGKVSVEQC